MKPSRKSRIKNKTNNQKHKVFQIVAKGYITVCKSLLTLAGLVAIVYLYLKADKIKFTDFNLHNVIENILIVAPTLFVISKIYLAYSKAGKGNEV